MSAWRTIVCAARARKYSDMNFKVRGSFSLVTSRDGCHTLLMAFRSKADWFAVDWSRSDRELASSLGVSHSAVAKRRKKLGHVSDYTVDRALLRGWFFRNRNSLPRMSDRDIRVEVFDQLDLMDFDVAYWRRQVGGQTAHAEEARPESVVSTVSDSE